LLIRQKIILALLDSVERPLAPTVFVKLAFLMRHETALATHGTFYEFVPYKYGPFSFALYRELRNLRRDGYVSPDSECVELNAHSASLVREKIAELPRSTRTATQAIADRYGDWEQTALLRSVYARYPWYAVASELTDLVPESIPPLTVAREAIYTAGYEGKSVDAFFDSMLRNGIKSIVDVRSNPVSRRYGFSRRQFGDIAERLGLGYDHMPRLGIPSSRRADLSDFDSYQRLLDGYYVDMLKDRDQELTDLGSQMGKAPTVLICVEQDVRCCHRSRLAEALALRTGMDVRHLP